MTAAVTAENEIRLNGGQLKLGYVLTPHLALRQKMNPKVENTTCFRIQFIVLREQVLPSSFFFRQPHYDKDGCTTLHLSGFLFYKRTLTDAEPKANI